MLALPFPPFWAGCLPELHTVLQLSMLVQTPHLVESGITLRTGDFLPVGIVFAAMFVILSIAKLKRKRVRFILRFNAKVYVLHSNHIRSACTYHREYPATPLAGCFCVVFVVQLHV